MEPISLAAKLTDMLDTIWALFLIAIILVIITSFEDDWRERRKRRVDDIAEGVSIALAKEKDNINPLLSSAKRAE